MKPSRVDHVTANPIFQSPLSWKLLRVETTLIILDDPVYMYGWNEITARDITGLPHECYVRSWHEGATFAFYE
jgi:hypothetical protein